MFDSFIHALSKIPAKFLHFFPWKILTSILCGAIIMKSKKYRYGLVAQLGAHHIRIVGVVGSNPIRSTKKTPFPLRDGVFFTESPLHSSFLLFLSLNICHHLIPASVTYGDCTIHVYMISYVPMCGRHWFCVSINNLASLTKVTRIRCAVFQKPPPGIFPAAVFSYILPI